MGRVCHSEEVPDSPPAPWLLTEKEGKVVSAHCNCMAGLGEACSHVGAVLFYIEAANKMKDWGKSLLDTSHNQQVQYKEISAIDFSSPKTLKKKNNHGLTAA